ncbi:MAG: DUF4124 domain-containing protein [Gammaproteobacteria bacterium]
MNKIVLTTLFVFFSTSAFSAIYKSVDKNGNTVYSDKPPASNSEAVKLAPMTTYKPPRYQPLSYGSREKEGDVKKYTQFRISSPEEDQGFWETTGAVKIATEIEPELQQDVGHQIQFYMDGYKQGKASSRASVSLVNVNRGEHSVYAQVIDDQGKVVQRSATVTFSLHKPSVKNRSTQGQQPPPPAQNTRPQ